VTTELEKNILYVGVNVPGFEVGVSPGVPGIKGLATVAIGCLGVEDIVDAVVICGKEANATFEFVDEGEFP